MNAPLAEREMREQLKDMAAHGAHSVCLHPLPAEFRKSISSAMSPAYLSEEYHRLIGAAVECCRELGMVYWLYDEGGWPSGSACGQVMRSDPERFAQRFVVEDKGAAQGFRIVKEFGNPEAGAVLPGITEPGTTQKFLELTHEAYAKHVGAHFGSTIRAAFTDEPYMPSPSPLREWCGGPAMLGWSSDFPEEFLKRKGYAIEPFVRDLLATRSVSAAGRLAEVRLDYYDVLADLIVERYFQPVRQWCRAHGLKSGGHLGGEDEWLNFSCTGFGHVLRSLRALDIPGVDMIWRQLYPGHRLHPFPKLASSAAHQNGGREVLGEMFAVYGSGLTPEVMKFLIDYMLVCGVNRFVFSGIGYSHRGSAMSGTRPHFGPADPLWPVFGGVHDYTARLAQVMSSGTSATEYALYFDMRSLWLGGRAAEYASHRTLESTRSFLERQCDFDYVDDEVLTAGEVRDGRLVFGGASYRAVVIPGGSLLTAAARQRLPELRRQGVQILTPDEIPQLEPALKLAPAAGAVRVRKLRLDGGNCAYFCFNTSSQPQEVCLELPEKEPVVFADAESGRLHQVATDGRWQYRFPKWGSALFITGESGEPLPAQPEETPALELTQWLLRPLRSYHVGESDFFTRDREDDAVPVQLSDWRQELGADFSGAALYTAQFDWQEKSAAAMLDLGVVACACEVVLNGQRLGRRLWPPYRLELTPALRRGVNTLEITVYNTLANALHAPGVEERWKRDFPPSGYEPLQRAFEAENMESGLFGPVRIFRTKPDNG